MRFEYIYILNVLNVRTNVNCILGSVFFVELCYRGTVFFGEPSFSGNCACEALNFVELRFQELTNSRNSVFGDLSFLGNCPCGKVSFRGCDTCGELSFSEYRIFVCFRGSNFSANYNASGKYRFYKLYFGELSCSSYAI